MANSWAGEDRWDFGGERVREEESRVANFTSKVWKVGSVVLRRR